MARVFAFDRLDPRKEPSGDGLIVVQNWFEELERLVPPEN